MQGLETMDQILKPHSKRKRKNLGETQTLRDPNSRCGWKILDIYSMLSRAEMETCERELSQIMNDHYHIGQLSGNLASSLHDVNQCNSLKNSYFQMDKNERMKHNSGSDELLPLRCV